MRRAFVAALALTVVLVSLAAFWGLRRSRRPVLIGPNIATIEFLDVGQGDAILIRSPEGKTALIDSGPSNRIVDQLRIRGIRSLDLVVVTHHHQDHYGGMSAVLRAFRPRVFLDADSHHATANYLALLRKVKEAKITAIRAGPSARKIELGSVRLTVLPQPPDDEANENNNSVGIRLDYERFSALLTGDSEGRERRWWTRETPGLVGKIDILKLAHHGSRNGTNADWLALTRPRLAIASLGAKNMFGHPHPEVVKLLRKFGIPFLRTDKSGSILVLTDGRTFSVDRLNSPSFAGTTLEIDEAGEPIRSPGLGFLPEESVLGINTGRKRRLRRR